MDDSQRVVVGGLGVALMAGAITWVGTVSIGSSNSWPLRVAVPLALFVVGAALVIWAAKTARNSRRAVLNMAIRDGHELLQQGAWATPALNWQNATAARLREYVGEAAANGLEYPGPVEGGVTARLRAQIAYLEGLRKRR
jgi:hypothetical protein